MRSLLAHFEDGLAAGRSEEELLATFGETSQAAALIARAHESGHSYGARWWRGSAGRDVRLALRRFRRSPGFVVTALLSLAIGIGANTAVFTLVNAILVREPPYPAVEQLYDVYVRTTDFAYSVLSAADLTDVREATRGMAVQVPASQLEIAQAQLSAAAEVELLPVELVNGDYFTGLGVGASLGRVLGAEDDVAPGAHPVVVLGWSYWQRTFGGSRDVVGREIRLSGRGFTIVGVVPREFTGTLRGLVPDLFVPRLMQQVLSPSDGDPFTSRSNRGTFAKIRLAPGAAAASLQSTLDALAADLQRRGEWQEDMAFRLVPTKDVVIFPPVDRFIRAAAWLLSGVVGLVLLIACANLASFLLAKSVDRRREIAVQLSLGATRGMLVRQLLVETLVLGVVAGGIGVLASIMVLQALTSADLPLPLPVTLDLAPDRTVMLYSLALSAFAGVVFGLAPALQSTRTQLAAVLRDETAGGGRRGTLSLRGMLVTAQVAVSLLLLVTAGLLLRSFMATQSVDPGFGTRPSAVLTLSLRADRWSGEEGIRFTDRLIERFRAIDGVSDVALTGRLHLDPLNTWSTSVSVDGVAPPPGRDSHSIDWTPVTPSFFDVLGVRIVSGRGFTEADRAGATGVVIINQAMADRFWPGEDAVGRTLRDSGTTLTVVGVASNAKVRTLGEEPRPQLYRPFAQEYSRYFVAVANTVRDAESTAIAMSRAARELDADVFTWEPKSMTRHLSTQLLARRLVAWIIGTFAILALVLASIGLYGLVSYSVAQRRREVGIRMTLGADRTAVLRLLLGQGLRLVAFGIVAGLLAALLLARLLGTLLYGVPPLDPLTFIAVPLVLLAVATIAAWLPAHRALRTDPAVALRAD